MTTAVATYQVNIADRGATVVAGNIDLTLAISDLAAIPTISGPSVDLLAARTTSHPFKLECIVDTVLFPSGGRLTELGRLIEIQRSDDGGAFSTIATGRISHASEIDGRGKITLEVSDERWVERGSEIFRTTDSLQLHPPGLANAWMSAVAAGEATYTVKEVNGSAVRIGAGDELGSDDIRPADPGLLHALATDLVAREDRDPSATNSAGNFTSLRFRYSAGDRTVICFRETLAGPVQSMGKTGLLGTMGPSEAGVLNDAWFYMAGHGLSVNDTISGRFYWPSGVAISEKVPLHIGGASGIHPMVLLQDVLDGDYGGQVTRYDSSQMTALQALPFKPVWARITEPANRGAWLEDSIYRTYGVVPMVGTDLNLRPTSLRLPVNVNPATYSTITAADTELPTWEHTSRELVTVLEFRCKAARVVSKEVQDRSVDGFELVERRIPDIEHDNLATLGEVRHKVVTDLILAPTEHGSEADRVARELAVELFDVFGDGAQKGWLRAPDDGGYEVGDHVLLDQDTLQGYNVEDEARTGDQIALLTAFREFMPASLVFDYLLLGPNSAILSAPTVAIAVNADADMVDVTISGLSAGETATVECTVDTTTPTAYDFVRSGVGNETISFRVNAASGTAYARAYATAPNRIRSDYGTDSVALSTRARVTSADVVIQGYSAVVTWTVPSGTAGMRTRYDVHDRDTDPTYANQTDYDATDGGFTITGLSPAQMVSVELTPYTGWTGAAVSGSAGDIVYAKALFGRVTGGIDLRRVSFVVTGVEVSFDEEGEAVVSATGDEDVKNMYVTVGNGSAPSDPTVATNDGVITGRSGSVATGIAITTGNDAYVRVVAADLAGNLSPVTEVRQERRLGPFHKDTTTRSTVGTGEDTLETIAVPADTLGADGVIRFTLTFDLDGSAGTKTVRLSFGGTGILTDAFSAGNTADVRIEVLLFNDGGTSVQQAEIMVWNASTGGSNQVFVGRATAAVDTTSSQNFVVTGECADGGDTINLDFSMAELVGTN